MARWRPDDESPDWVHEAYNSYRAMGEAGEGFDILAKEQDLPEPSEWQSALVQHDSEGWHITITDVNGEEYTLTDPNADDNLSYVWDMYDFIADYVDDLEVEYEETN